MLPVEDEMHRRPDDQDDVPDELRELAELVAERASDVPDADERFVASVMARVQGEQAERAPTRARLAWLSAAVAACALGALTLTLVHTRPGSDLGSFTARGARTASSLQTLAGCELSLVRGGRRSVPSAGTTLGDALMAFDVTNGTTQPLYLLAFAIDAAHEVHWFYPAYLDASHNPSAERIEAGTRNRTLPQLVRPERPAPGTLTVVTLLSTRARHVKEVEALLKGHETELDRLFSGENLRTWSLKVSP